MGTSVASARTRYVTGRYLSDNPDWHVDDSAWKAQQILKIMRRNHLKFHSVCDVGCGAGQILVELRDQLPATCKFYGYEISPQAYGMSRRRAGERVNFFLQDVTTEDVFYDVLMAIDVLEHISDYWGFLEQLRNKGRYKIFHVPLAMNVAAVLRPQRLLEGRRSVGHIHYFMAETALATLVDAGYEVLDYCYTAQGIETKTRNRRWQRLAASLPRRLLRRIHEPLAARLLGGFSLMVLAK